MQALSIIAAALVASAAAMPIDPEMSVCTKDSDCVAPSIDGQPGVTLKCVNFHCTDIPSEGPFPDISVVPVKPVVPAPDCEDVEVDLSVCVDVPANFCRPAAMIPDVAYTVPAMYECKEGEEMTIWCEVDKKHKRHNYFYCCNDKCKNIPEERTCEVDGNEYTVGHAYDIKLEGKKVTMWCTSEDEYLTCSGKKCGSTVELTPPGLEVCMPEDCDDVVVPPTMGPSGDVTPSLPSVDAVNRDCRKCIAKGGAFLSTTNECMEKQCRSVDCIVDVELCPYGVMPISA